MSSLDLVHEVRQEVLASQLLSAIPLLRGSSNWKLVESRHGANFRLTRCVLCWKVAAAAVWEHSVFNPRPSRFVASV